MLNNTKYFRFSGRLLENMVFKKTLGWETDWVAHRPSEGDGTYQLELRDKDDKMLVSISPLVDFAGRCRMKGQRLRTANIATYIPIHPMATELIFRREELIIHREKISPDPPSIRIMTMKILEQDKVQIRWAAKHPQRKALRFNIIYLIDNRARFLLAQGLQHKQYTADLSHLPGSKRGRLAVIATDGLRSAFVVSKPFNMPGKPPYVWIQRPNPGELLPADQPISFCGGAFDISGTRLPDEGLVWYVNEQVIARGTRMQLVEKLEPGYHRVALEYTTKKKTLARQDVDIHIAERSPAQKLFLSELQRFKESR